MITGFTIAQVEGKIDSVEALAKQRFPRINMSIDSVSANGASAKVNYSYTADYYDRDITDFANIPKDVKAIGHLKLGGVVEVTDTKEKIALLGKTWAERRTLPVDSLSDEILSGLNFRCGATGTLVAYALGLIPPLSVSPIRLQETK